MLRAVLCAALSASALAASSIDVAVKAPWPTGPSSFLLEASEFLSEEDPQGLLFWRYVNASTDALAREVGTRGAASAAALASSPGLPLALARTLLAPITLDVLRVSLAARAASPAVESHRQLALQSPGRAVCGGGAAWADVAPAGSGAGLWHACSAEQLAGALASASAASAGRAPPSIAGVTYAWDHAYPYASPAAQLAAAGAPLVLFYADLGHLGGVSAPATALAAAVEAAVAASAARAVFRHAPAPAPQGVDSTTWLSGFGAALDIKSTEYKVIDDRSAAAASLAADARAAAAAGGAADMDSRAALRALDTTTATFTLPEGANSEGSEDARSWEGGVDWAVLGKAVGPEKAKALAAARAAAAKASPKAPSNTTTTTTTATTSSFPHLSDLPLQPWHCSALGLQAAAYVMDAAAAEARVVSGGGEVGPPGGVDDPLAALVRVTGNFPALAPWLSTLPIPPLLRTEVASNTRFAPPGTATMTLNGITVEASSNFFNLFSLFKTLRAESRTVEMLDTLPLSLEDRRRVLGLAYKDGGGAAAGGGGGRDVETDAIFKSWPSDISGLMQPTWQLHQLRRNLYNALCVLEMAPASSLRALQMLLTFKQMRIPIRMGVALLPGKSAEETAALTPPFSPLALGDRAQPASSLQLAMLFNAATARFGPTHGGAAFVVNAVTGWAEAAGAAAAAAQAAAAGGGEGGSAGGMPPPFLPISIADACAAFAALAKQTSSAWWREGIHRSAKKTDKAPTAKALLALAEEALVDGEGALRAGMASGPAAWVAARGIPTPSTLFNGRVLPGLDFQSALMPAVQQDMSLLQQAVYKGLLDDAVAPSVLHAFLGKATVLSEGGAGGGGAGKKGKAVAGGAGEAQAQAQAQGTLTLPGAGVAVSRFHPAIFASEEDQVFVPLSAPEALPLVNTVAYLHAPGTADAVKPVSLTLLDDLSTPTGLASAAALLAFVRGPSDNGTAPCPGPSALAAQACDPLPAPTSVAQLRVGLLHVPPLSSAAASAAGASTARAAFTTVGDLVSLTAALVSGRDPALLEVRSADQGPAVAAVVDFARAALAAAPQAPLPHLLSQLKPWLLGGTLGVLRPKVAEALWGALEEAFSPPSAAGAAASKQGRAAGLAAIAAAHATASDVARTLLPASLPATQTLTASHMHTRGLLANGRLLALSGEGGEGQGTAAASAATTTLGARATVEDLTLLANTERASRGAAVARLVQGVTFPPSRLPNADPDALTAEWISSVVMGAASAVGSSSKISVGGSTRGRVNMRTSLLASEATSFVTRPRRQGGGAAEGEEGSIGLSVTAIIDPASADAQKAAPLLLLLRDALGAVVTVHLVPPPEGTLSELPVKSTFRYVLPGDIPSSSSGVTEANSALVHPRASFSWLSTATLLTLKLATPEPWNVQPSLADVDCDNIRLSPGQHVTVEYALKDLLVAGQCLDTTEGDAVFPNGLQLVLGPRGAVQGNASSSSSSSEVAPPLLAFEAPHTPSDTLVMMNLGYWQLKAQPGVWSVGLAPGRATELFTLLSAEGGGSSSGSSSRQPSFWGGGGGGAEVARVPAPALSVAVRDFTGPFTSLHVKKLPGMEGVALLSTLGEGGSGGLVPAAAAPPSLLGSISSLFGGGGRGGGDAGSERALAVDKPLVHVFSIASGHLYERFLKIMMLSAIKRSPSVRLKFWLVENFLSPQFKAQAPALVAHFGAEVAFVTYKWPNWLRGQTEKQRLIWGYKILFLDVLFPLDVQRIIFVDADQIIRSDLRELAEMDLQGAPYAFTPFCDSRKETLGYQFWREGFWKDHLRGRPYHISALYVVDLVAFRRSAVGDQLRATYEQLSRDPASLANLDQDLPNFAQTSIPIHSLPQEWLWCESWCSDSSKAAAKTIDLCNNPRFKEPKLNMARRVINGTLFQESWDELDGEVQRLSAEVSAAGAAAAAAGGSVGGGGGGMRATEL